MGPGSSTVSIEQPVHNRQEASSTLARGSTYLFLVVRKDFDVPNGVVQLGHALTECLEPGDIPLPKDTRMVFVGATKEELTKVRADLEQSQLRHSAIVEIDGALAGCVTAIGIITTDRDGLKAKVPLLAELKRWKEPKAPK